MKLFLYRHSHPRGTTLDARTAPLDVAFLYPGPTKGSDLDEDELNTLEEALEFEDIQPGDTLDVREAEIPLPRQVALDIKAYLHNTDIEKAIEAFEFREKGSRSDTELAVFSRLERQIYVEGRTVEKILRDNGFEDIADDLEPELQ